MDGRSIQIHDQADFSFMRVAGKLAAEVLDFVTDHVAEGVSTGYLDQICHEYIIKANAIPAPLNYRGFPKSTCISINHVVCHGIPDFKRKLQKGDILNIDITVIVDGWYGDSSRMYIVGDKPSVKAQKLIDVTYDCLMAGIEMVKPGAYFGDIGYVIQNLAESKRYGVVRDFCGHGIGREFHSAPSILHYGQMGDGQMMRAGMIFTIEPMINTGTWQVKLLNDGWTAVTKDKGLSAQFEHTIGVTEDGYEIFTLSPKRYSKPPYN